METGTATHIEWCRRSDQLVSELSLSLCEVDSADLGAALEPMLRSIGQAVGVDRVTLVEFSGDAEEATYQWTDASVDVEGADPGEAVWLWDLLRPDHAPLVLERIPDDVPSDAAPALLEHVQRIPLRSAVVMPGHVGGDLACALALESVRDAHAWPPVLLDRLRVLAALVGAALHRRRQDVELRVSRADVRRLNVQSEREKQPVDDGASAPDIDGIIGKSAALRSALARIREVAPTSSSVLLLGETGTGKELFARAVHAQGPRRANPLVSVNCAALPPTLIESELFGHARGAFTGAVIARLGRFEMAHRGTLFLDEIGDLPLDLQTKLLRVLQEGAFERLGSSVTQKVDVRIIAATHRDLAKSVAEGTFRDDLFYRLSVFPIRLPPLRHRREDIPDLVWHIIHRRERAMGRSIRRVPESVMETLQRRDWPGNVRELENVVERALIHSRGDTLILLEDGLDQVDRAEPADGTTLSAVERTHIEEVLRVCRGRINGPGNAAERLGLHPNTLRFRMKKLGIVRDASRLQVSA